MKIENLSNREIIDLLKEDQLLLNIYTQLYTKCDCGDQQECSICDGYREDEVELRRFIEKQGIKKKGSLYLPMAHNFYTVKIAAAYASYLNENGVTAKIVPYERAVYPCYVHYFIEHTY